MTMARRELLLFSFSLCIYSHFHVLNSQNLSCNPKDLIALNGFLEGLASGIDNMMWDIVNSSSDCCLWVGIECEFSSSALSGKRVVGLSLGNIGLKGFLSKSLAGLDQLRVLNLSHNSLMGSIPLDLFHLKHLEVFDLSYNSFVGVLSHGVGNLSNLIHLHLSFNGFYGIIPDVFHSLVRLEYFSASSNGFTGSLPTSLFSCSMLATLSLSNNYLGGGIDFDFSKLSRLTVINLSVNRFRGPIPSTLSSCRNLRTINFGRNNLHGEIPRSFQNLQALTFMSLSNNSFSNISRALTILQKCRKLFTLVLTMNFRGEEMPSKGIQGFKRLNVLVVPYCALSGSIPSWLTRCTELSMLDLSWNFLSGAIPAWLGGLDHLFYLDFSNNSLTGEIPKNLTQLKSLTYGRNDTSDSSLDDIPLWIKRNQTVEVQYNHFFNFPPTLDLSRNKLVGMIWKEFGEMRGVHVLNLSLNNFSGPIPDELSGMVSLEVLDLSYNHLSGNIPSSLMSLSFLSKFSVANNHLRGLIPSGGQFSTFPNSSFGGNPGLCGQLFAPCGRHAKPSNNPSPDVKREGNEKSIITGLPFKTGALVGFIFSVIICMMLRWKRG